MTVDTTELRKRAEAAIEVPDFSLGIALRRFRQKVYPSTIIALLDELTAAQDGLFRVVQALGFDTDGAKSAREFFGPLTYLTPDASYTTAEDIAVAFAAEYREEVEADADALESRAVVAEGKITRALERLEHVMHPNTTRCYICDVQRILTEGAPE